MCFKKCDQLDGTYCKFWNMPIDKVIDCDYGSQCLEAWIRDVDSKMILRSDR